MSLFAPAPEPKTPLGRRRPFARSCGLRVSPLCLGAMSIGQAWSKGMGSMDKEQAFKLLDAFVEAGGNFIDTANNYQEQESEIWLGEWMKSRNNRDEMIIATKYTTMYRSDAKDRSNFSGNSLKSMSLSVEASLKKLQTSTIDLLWVHWWDWMTPIEEVMNGLNNLIRSGKVLYIGVSDTPAWVVSRANQYARDHGMSQFVAYQGKWSVAERDFERDIIDMARYEGMALVPWNALGGGRFQTKKQIEERKKQGEGIRALLGPSEQTEVERNISAALEKVAGEVGADSITAVALAYVMQKAPYVFPLVGGRKIEHLHDNIKSLSIALSDEQIKYLESVVPFDVGFPKAFILDDPHTTNAVSWLTGMSGHFDFPIEGHVRPRQK